jgi:hypothetical protein
MNSLGSAVLALASPSPPRLSRTNCMPSLVGVGSSLTSLLNWAQVCWMSSVSSDFRKVR